MVLFEQINLVNEGEVNKSVEFETLGEREAKPCEKNQL